MQSKTIGKIIVDLGMTVLLMLLMAFELIGRTAHESGCSCCSMPRLRVFVLKQASPPLRTKRNGGDAIYNSILLCNFCAQQV